VALRIPQLFSQSNPPAQYSVFLRHLDRPHFIIRDSHDLCPYHIRPPAGHEHNFVIGAELESAGAGEKNRAPQLSICQSYFPLANKVPGLNHSIFVKPHFPKKKSIYEHKAATRKAKSTNKQVEWTPQMS
jgi:hypothetical protein